jgi:hypothetical protein
MEFSEVHIQDPYRILHSPGPVPNPKPYILWCCIKMQWGEWREAFIVLSSLVGYDGGEHVSDEERRVAVESSPPSAPDSNDKSEKRSSSIPLWLVVSAVIAVGGVVEVVIYGYLETPGWVGVSDKKFWDYLELLVVPAALALGVYWLNRAQQERERKADEVQRKREDAAEEAREQRELEFANQTTQNAALQSYIVQMTQLLINRNAPQLLSESRIRETIHARTLHVLDQLDEIPRGRLRKRALLRFLYKTELIPGRFAQDPPYDTNILFEANLRHADLESLRLEGSRPSRCGSSRCEP